MRENGPTLMICPNCGQEYDDILIRVCPACDVDLVDRLPGAEPDPNIELVPVFATGDPACIAFVESLLEGEGIEYFVRSDGVQDLVGYGRFGAGFNIATGPAEFVVRAEDAERARGLLEGVRPEEPGPDDPDDTAA
jgi:putative signal transducing protein